VCVTLLCGSAVQVGVRAQAVVQVIDVALVEAAIPTDSEYFGNAAAAAVA